MEKEKISINTEIEINFMPTESDRKYIKNDYIYQSFPPERIAEMDEDLLWNI